ncbi:MAG TPA: hypothetical protein VLT91_03000 [Rhizomicrobium sp.]|nr:hypothetical protein [Rhizomicrobium sp.]
MSEAAILARVIHVLGVVIWIGGVGFVTAVVIPACAAMPGPEAAEQFERFERRFAWIARAMVLLVGASGLDMLWQFDLWSRFTDAGFWWMHAMVIVWTVFAIVLFVMEPLLHQRIAARMRRDPQATFRAMRRMHWILLLVSLVTIAGAVAGAHGYSFSNP